MHAGCDRAEVYEEELAMVALDLLHGDSRQLARVRLIVTLQSIAQTVAPVALGKPNGCIYGSTASGVVCRDLNEDRAEHCAPF